MSLPKGELTQNRRSRLTESGSQAMRKSRLMRRARVSCNERMVKTLTRKRCRNSVWFTSGRSSARSPGTAGPVLSANIGPHGPRARSEGGGRGHGGRCRNAPGGMAEMGRTAGLGDVVCFRESTETGCGWLQGELPVAALWAHRWSSAHSIRTAWDRAPCLVSRAFKTPRSSVFSAPSLPSVCGNIPDPPAGDMRTCLPVIISKCVCTHANAVRQAYPIKKMN